MVLKGANNIENGEDLVNNIIITGISFIGCVSILVVVSVYSY